jgi:hypothetical protein
MNTDKIEQAFWALFELFPETRSPNWAPDRIALRRAVGARAFGQRFKLDVTVANDGAHTELVLNLEPTPRQQFGERPPALAAIAQALSRLGFAGDWTADPGHAALSGRWRRPLKDWGDTEELLGLTLRLGDALEEPGERREIVKSRASSPDVTGRRLLERIQRERSASLVASDVSFHRVVMVNTGTTERKVRVDVTSLGGSFYKSAVLTLENGEAASVEVPRAMQAVIGRAAGNWTTDSPLAWVVVAPLRSLDAASRFALENDSRYPET